MTSTLHHHQPQINTVPQQSFAATFQTVLRKIELGAQLSSFQQTINNIQSSSKQVTPKMRCKLLSWLQKLSTSTFQFQRSTFIISTLILDQHLAANDQSPKNLQMIGCACLFIASKLNQSVIVAPECYTTACCSIFNKNQLLQKELNIYSQISWKKIRIGAHNLIKSGCLKLSIKQKYQRSLEVLCLLIKQEEYNCDQLKLVHFILALVIAQEENLLSNQQVLILLKNYQ